MKMFFCLFLLLVQSVCFSFGNSLSRPPKTRVVTQTIPIPQVSSQPPNFAKVKTKPSFRSPPNNAGAKIKSSNHPMRVKTKTTVSEYQCRNDNNQHVIQECNKIHNQPVTFTPPNSTLFHIYKPLVDQDVKYFKEAVGDDHRDARYYTKNRNAVTNVELRNAALTELFVEWSHFTQEKNLTYWIAHGLLIGYYWNNDLLPWDQDLDVQVTAHDLLNTYPKYHNFKYKNRYLLDINPHSRYRLYQFDNVIDARFIDVTNGYYLDITGVSFNPKRGVFQCKSPHSYRYDVLFPLREGQFCGERVYVPQNVENILVKEYGAKCIKNPVYRTRINHREETYKFDRKLHAWLRE